MKILVAGGGTAGHISPVLAVIASIHKLNPATEILFVCSGNDYETSLLKHSGIDYKVIPSGKFRRYGRGKLREITDFKTQALNATDILKTIKGYSYSRKIIKQFRPDVIFIKGGHVGLPVGLAAAHLNIPYVIHESDVVMGKANSILAKRASAIAVSFPKDAYSVEDTSKLYFTGNPVRPEYYIDADTIAKKPSEQKPNIMIFAGSQGAEFINNLIFSNIELLTKNFNILHIAGKQGIERARFMKHRLPAEQKHSYDPHGFLTSEMLAAYHWSDIVVARAGMNSISELAALSKPSIIIPLPSSTNQHQLKNAQYLARQGAIRLLQQNDIEGLRLINDISKLYDDKNSMQYLATTIHKFFKPDASISLAQIIISLGNKNKGPID
ncbi:UDP-N-acetylglucosamine--N-acetylmuramyl-(pentapeptide) pyrophosphoryl-undecaprenol N-acetylglucosamine transferase [Patescibacteria group bacterium]|nr:UDP-N-acetylglucosamine--N-acetylmuramyl-(pentapeptide) pyrophosphoryl-undecaprenol N-acetylglucosamine transferase [Patescibacteria group bacterium]